MYHKTDVLLLANVFETFRTVCHNKNSYGLDPVHYYTVPGLAWSAMLKMTKQNLELISAIDMLLMKRWLKEEEYLKYVPRDMLKQITNIFLIIIRMRTTLT